MANRNYLAIDIGASSGRHVIGRFDGQRLALEEIHRFENGPIDLGGSLYWDLPRLWQEIVAGLQIAGKADGAGCGDGTSIASVGVDTWGVDFGLLGANDEILGMPYHYRDARTEGVLERAFAEVSRETIFRNSGLQFMPLNTLYQLLAMKWTGSPLLDIAETMLLMPDLFHWLMTGEKACEFSNATTTQFYNPTEQRWATELLEMFGLPTRQLAPIVQPGTDLGPLRTALAAETGLSGTRVILPGTHDTASAVMAVPARSTPGERPDWCYLSLGTWALMGIESPTPVVTDQVMALNFTNEGGVGGTTRLLKNICGLWLVQQCRQAWNRDGKNWGWEDLNQMSAAARPFVTLINPDAPDFVAPADMPGAICEFAKKTGQPVPENEGAVLRAALESLALKFRQVLGMCEELNDRRIETIHIVGGGTQNRQLCQMTADCCGRRVVAGPIEATATGNIMMQAVACGDVADIRQAREVIAASFELEEYEPTDTAVWDDAYGRFLELC